MNYFYKIDCKNQKLTDFKFQIIKNLLNLKEILIFFYKIYNIFKCLNPDILIL